MKSHIHLIVIILLIAGFGILGISKRSSYTNITSNPTFINDFSVPEMPTEFVEFDCKMLQNSLSSACAILKVTPVDTPEYFFGGRQQKVYIEEVFQGDSLDTGHEIYITADHWKVYIDDKTLDTGFVNIPKEGEDYLVFVSDSVGYAKDKSEIFRLCSGQYINAIFSYTPHQNEIYPTSGESTYVPYNKVSGNEFFAVDEKGLAVFLSLKQEVISSYQ